MLLPCAGDSAKSVYNTPYSPRYIHGPSGGRRPSRLSQAHRIRRVHMVFQSGWGPFVALGLQVLGTSEQAFREQ